MKTTDLIALAEASGTPLATICRELGVNPSALGVAKYQGRLSPGLAAALADYLGESIERWALQAITEGERNAPLRRRLDAIASRAKQMQTRSPLGRPGPVEKTGPRSPGSVGPIFVVKPRPSAGARNASTRSTRRTGKALTTKSRAIGPMGHGTRRPGGGLMLAHSAKPGLLTRTANLTAPLAA
jgi:hypothetical protein